MKRRTPFLALVTIAMLSPVITWWLVGDQSEPDRPGGLDFLFQPLPMSNSQEALVGTSATAVVVAALAVVSVASALSTTRPGNQTRRACMVALTLRSLTAMRGMPDTGRFCSREMLDLVLQA